MKIALATDHTGYEKLQRLQQFLEFLNHECINFGPKTLSQEDDYPDYIFPAARAVADGKCERGIIMGGSGEGEAMCANRVKGVRCALYYGAAQAAESIDAEGHQAADTYEILRLSRQHNDANILCLAARFLSEKDMEKALGIWLETPFSAIDRHQRRIGKMDELA